MEKTDPGVDDIPIIRTGCRSSEIETFSAELAGLDFRSLRADSCPRQERTLDACMKVLDYAKSIQASGTDDPQP
ncbi:MAG: hypothetical protein ACLVG5_06415 [Clostridium sp.]